MYSNQIDASCPEWRSRRKRCTSPSLIPSGRLRLLPQPLRDLALRFTGTVAAWPAARNGAVGLRAPLGGRRAPPA